VTNAERQREWRRNNPEKSRESTMKARLQRRAALDEIKVAKGCVDCGYNAAPEALHFDHRDPSQKLFGISESKTRNWNLILAEIGKCDVRCANCHAIKSRRDGDHGAGRPRLMVVK
jgi:hypothetical protein